MSKKSGFLAGALIGAAAALFFAPKKGSEMREDASKMYDDFKDDPEAAINNLRDLSADKFNDIKERFDSGEISADSAKEYLTSKRDLIKEKVDSGELSKESVIEFFNSTRDAIVDKINQAKEGTEELFDENESEITDEVVEKTAEFKEKLNDNVDKAVDKAEEVKDDTETAIDENVDFGEISEEAEKLEKKAKDLSETEW
ncbi:YtxH domain-containing protein [Lactococcus garvieae]|jgi:gas vesicle protein|uniref:YtxH domain-containing protein n=1 Tax=Lactococcus garvieae TaxID=1363 RepID=UPI0009BD5772|nr:YtxH domain-containing protein [Lactococcus garvieae]QPS70345.1 YtxH domain-containing protein [Lactococcus garvieae]